MNMNLSNFVDFEGLGILPPEIIAAAESAVTNLLPKKSKDRYEIEFHHFECWMKAKKVSIINETVLLAYFGEKVCYK